MRIYLENITCPKSAHNCAHNIPVLTITQFEYMDFQEQNSAVGMKSQHCGLHSSVNTSQ